MIRSGNPALRDSTFTRSASFRQGEEVMTLQGAVNKTGLLLLITLFGAGISWHKFYIQQSADNPMLWTTGGAIVGFILAIVISFKRHLAPTLAPIYGFVEGIFLGALSSFFEMRFPGIVVQAVGLTFMTLFALLFAYRSGMIKPTENFKLGLAAATGGIFLVYLASMILGFFGIQIPLIHESGLVGIGFSVVVVIIAALNLVLDFDFIENGAARGAPKYMEWYAAFGLLVTLIWLYLEILRLLAKLQSRR